MLKNPLLHNPAEIDAALAGVLEGPTDELARATRPAFLANDRSPVEWSGEDWDRMAAERRDLLDMASVSAQFDAEAFLLDGYAVFREVMTLDAIDEWIAALRRGQQLNDALLRADWNLIDWHDLVVTSEPLKIDHLALPPGSIVYCLSHAAHGVAPKAPGRQTRWCSLHCYRKADDTTGHVQPPSAVPPVWAMKAQRGELPSDLAKLLRHSHDRDLTGGRTDHDEP